MKMRADDRETALIVCTTGTHQHPRFITRQAVDQACPPSGSISARSPCPRLTIVTAVPYLAAVGGVAFGKVGVAHTR